MLFHVKHGNTTDNAPQGSVRDLDLGGGAEESMILSAVGESVQPLVRVHELDLRTWKSAFPCSHAGVPTRCSPGPDVHSAGVLPGVRLHAPRHKVKTAVQLRTEGNHASSQEVNEQLSRVVIRAEGRAHQSGLAHWARNTGRGGACALQSLPGGISARQHPEARRSGLLVRAEGRAHQSGLAHWARNTGRGGACALQSLPGGISAHQHPRPVVVAPRK